MLRRRMPIRGRLLQPAVAAALYLASSSPIESQTTFVATVGDDAATCSHTDLQSAIDAARASTADRKVIRLDRQSAFVDVSVVVRDVSLEIIGGFAGCQAATPSGRTEILSGDQGVLQLSGEGYEIRIARLDFMGGNIDQGSGGAMAVDGVGRLQIEDCRFIGNVAGNGGAISIFGESDFIAVRLENVELVDNRVQVLDGLGGAIFCRGNVDLRIEASLFVGNRTPSRGSGGSVAVVDRCHLEMVGPNVIEDSRAGHGGGIYLEDASAVLRATAEGAPRIARNHAGRGAGIALSGAHLATFGARIDGNIAESLGGGLFVQDSVVRLGEALGADCPTPGRCATLSNNESIGDGAAAQLVGGSQLVLANVFVEGNRSDGPIFDLEEVSTLVAESALIAGNTGPSLIVAKDRSRVDMRFSTIADNDLGEGVLFPTESEVALFGSIVDQPGLEVVTDASASTLSAECVLAHEIDSLPAGPRVFVGDARFVDPSVRNYRLQPGSDAMDACAEVPAPVGLDVELRARGFDDPGTPNAAPGAVLDLGAYERGGPRAFFAKGFESGDLSGWSAVTGPIP